MSLKEKNRGRPDIYIVINGTGVSIEAKRKWLCASAKDAPSKSFSTTMKRAMCDVKKVTEGEVRFGVGFFPLFFPQKAYRYFKSKSSIYISQEIEKYAKGTEIDILSWYFPKIKRKEEPYDDNNNARSTPSYYPGIIMAAKKL